jgi:type I restriction enzyme S subunit
MPQNIGDNVIDERGIARITSDDAYRLEKYLLAEGDIVYSRRGDVEKRALVRDHSAGWLCGTGCLRVRVGDPDRTDARFVSYLLGTPETRAWISRHAVGATMPNLNTKILSSVPLQVPSISEQQAIAEVLGALDDKIAANIALASTAWELAGAEFAKISLSSTEPRRLGEVVRLEYGKSLPTPSRQPGEIRVVGSGGVVGQHSTAMVDQTGVVVGRKGTAGSVHWIDGPHWPIDTTFYVTPVAPGVSQIYAYFLLSRLKLDQLNSDSAVPGLNRAEAEAIKLHIPSRERREQFAASTSALIELASQASRESNTLVEMRNTLLPELMSGRIRVKDAEKKIEEVV